MLHLVLGAPDSGRLPIVRDLVAGGLPPDEPALLLSHCSDHAPEKLSAEQSARDLASPNHLAWTWTDEHIQLPPEAEQAAHLFLLLAPKLPLPPQIEATLALLQDTDGLQLARIHLIIHCGLLPNPPPGLEAWHDACAHFADVALLSQRTDAPPRLVQDLRDRYEKKLRYPLQIELVRKNYRIHNPALVLSSTSRRISHVFDPPEDLEPDDLPASDHYLERLPGGTYANPVPLPFGET